jgi:4-diphosphocytidyl-2-C-methyl-D-erythritol kinase
VAEVRRLLAPAKLTLSLQVTGRRPDGYHELTSEMVSINLCDELEIDDDGAGLEIVADQLSPAAQNPLGPAADNLVTRALGAVGRTAGVRLVKRIPVGGGLGGGSSDAAAVLRWAGCADLAMAARLGSDVPFCVVGGRAMVGGLGELVTPLPDEPRSFVLLVPPLAVSTAAVYRTFDALAPPGREPGSGGNDLTEAALIVEPALASWREVLGEATERTPRLAGSGATWFVEGTSEVLGLAARDTLSLEGETGRLLAVRTVPAGWEGESLPNA